MGKDLRKKTRGPWWYGWVKYTYYDPFTKSEREGTRATDWDFSTAGQAQRAADQLAGALAAPESRWKRWNGEYSRSKTDKRESRLTVVQTGASRVS